MISKFAHPKSSIKLIGGLLLSLVLAVTSAPAANLHLKMSKRSKPTPVQQLNQSGVKALQKGNVPRAKRDFYKAYLLDPDDPFTLNNLGYIAEIDGEIDKAQKFYDLAAANGSDATVAFSSDPELKGKEVSQIAGKTVSASMQVNRLNVAAMGLMMKDHAPEAELALRKAMVIDPKNPFTLNNLGYALEKEGELEQAERFYSQAAASGSSEKIVVALNRSWRGRSISEVAGQNANAARRELGAEALTAVKVARFNLRGVSALNRKQLTQARQYFQQAYLLDHANAFTLNNMGYISEVEGDRETAEFYYAKAREANRSSARVALATSKSFEGMKLAAVAGRNQQVVQTAQEKDLNTLRAEGAVPLPLRTRDRAIIREPASPPRPEAEVPVRILAEDNPPPERPPAMASSPARSRARTRVPPPPAAQQPPPQAQPVTIIPPNRDDETPLLPVIPDEAPSR